jgi:ribosomal protein L15E
MCYMIKSRLIFCLRPAQYYCLEEECQRLATEIMLYKEHQACDRNGKLVWTSSMSQSEWIARGVIDTKDAWSQGWETRARAIERWKFRDWCKSIGRVCPA